MDIQVLLDDAINQLQIEYIEFYLFKSTINMGQYFNNDNSKHYLRW